MDDRAQAVWLSPVVQLILKAGDIGQLLELLDLPVSFVTDQCAVEVHSKHNEHQTERHHDGGGGDGRCLTRADGTVDLPTSERQELDPAQENHLRKEQQGADDSGERPG